MLFGAFALLFSSISSAAIISGEYTVNGTQVVDLSGLEWMSFDHTEGGIDYSSFSEIWNTYDDTDSIWADAGWSLATETHVTALYDSLGLTNGSNSDNGDGVEFLHTNFGAEQIGAQIYDSPAYTRTMTAYSRVNGVYQSDVTDFGALFTTSAYTAIFEDNDDTDSTDYTIYNGTTQPYVYNLTDWSDHDNAADSGDNWAAFFVRIADEDSDGGGNEDGDSDGEGDGDSVSVPEPSIIALFGAGLVGLGFARRRKSRQA